jgi:6,7-dimethyl-8-ribityllumazine synthase
MVHELQATADGRGLAIAIVVARFNPEVTGRLLDGARKALAAAGVAADAITVARVPGAFELPVACRWLAGSGRFDAVVALGAVIRGDTDHYEHICRAATDGILRVALDTGVPIGFGVLTCATEEQGLARAGGAAGDKGADAALAALEMARLRRRAQDGRSGAPAG